MMTPSSLLKEMDSGNSCSTPKAERKTIEKNRRNQMKTLYSKLCSLLPNHTFKEGLPLPDQMDEAVKYIRTLETKLEKSKEKNEKLLGRKRSHACITSEIRPSLKSPEIEIHQMGPDLHAILINGLHNQIIFYEIIRVLHEEGAEVVHASFSTFGNSIFHVVCEKIGESLFTSEAAMISNRLKEFIDGSPFTEVEPLQLESGEFEIQPDMW